MSMFLKVNRFLSEAICDNFSLLFFCIFFALITGVVCHLKQYGYGQSRDGKGDSSLTASLRKAKYRTERVHKNYLESTPYPEKQTRQMQAVSTSLEETQKEL